MNIDPLFKDLIPAFLEKRDADLNNIENFLVSENYTEIAKIAHVIKGVGGTYGFPEISVYGTDIENFAQKKQPEAILKTINELRVFVQKIKDKISDD